MSPSADLTSRLRDSRPSLCLFPSSKLKMMFLPDALHRCRADAPLSRHQTDAPMRGVLRGAMQGRFNQCRLLCRSDPLRPAGTRPILQNSRQAIRLEAPAPQQDRRKTRPQFPRQDLVSDSLRRTQNDPDSQCHALRDATQANNLQQLPAIFLRNHKRGGRSAGHRSLSMGQSQAKVKLFMSHYTRKSRNRRTSAVSELRP